MKEKINYNFSDSINHQTLLYGETNSGKTQITSNFIKFLIESLEYDKNDISILDFAPNLEIYQGLKIGGRIEEFYEKSRECNYIPIEGKIIPPRLQASNKNELYENACKNYKISSKILEEYDENPTNILIINDISIYLHLGCTKHLLESISRAETFFGNTYYGSSITQNFAERFSLVERKKVELIIKEIERTVNTDTLI